MSDIDIEAFRKEMSDRLNAIAVKVTGLYCEAIAVGNIPESKKTFELIKIMEEASGYMKTAPVEELANILKIYSDRMDELM